MLNDLNLNYRFEAERGEAKSRYTVNFYHRVNPDGSAWTRSDAVWASGKSFTTLTIADGTYTITDGQVVRDGNSKPVAHAEKELDRELDRNSPVYTLTEETRNGTACYKITRTLTVPAEADRCPAFEEYYISKKDQFIRETRVFNRTGKPILELVRKNIKFDPVFSDALFVPPPLPER